MGAVKRATRPLAASSLNFHPASVPVAEARPIRWTINQAQAWQKRVGWRVGCNFIPSTAINQLEMWQEESFDPAILNRELGWAQKLGFNTVRVYLHHLLWAQDSGGYLERVDKFLKLADRHQVGVIFVLLDGVWDPHPRLGSQPVPKPGVHNSGWLQSPGVDILANPARHEELRDYIYGTIRGFREDRRVLLWDIFNEPDNLNQPAYAGKETEQKAKYALMLLKESFAWARQAGPSQPISAGVWIGNWADPQKLTAIERFCLENSDVITFHNYGKLPEMKQCVRNLRRYQRPLLCTEYMSRGNGSTFNPILGFLKEQEVGAIHWGLVAGKTQTIYPWDSWTQSYAKAPPQWFHDVLRTDGTPYDEEEVEYIRSVVLD